MVFSIKLRRIFCRGRVSRPAPQGVLYKKRTCFKRFKILKNRFFLFTKYNLCAEKLLRDSGRETRPLQNLGNLQPICEAIIIPNFAFRIPNLINLLLQFSRNFKRCYFFRYRLAIDCQGDFFACDLVIEDFHYRIKVFYGFSVYFRDNIIRL